MLDVMVLLAVQFVKRLKSDSVFRYSGMYEENPGADMFKQDVILVKTGNSAATMKKQFHSL